MKLTVKLLDLGTRGVLLHAEDAGTIGVMPGDRVQVQNDASGVTVAAFVDTTKTLLPQGTIGIYRITNERLQVTEKAPVEVRSAERPVTLDYIRKKMDGGHLSKEETYAIIRDVVGDNISATELTAYITACYINEMDMDEVENLTRAMVDTGERLTFHTHPIVDKHSIGGSQATRSRSSLYLSSPPAA